MKAYKKNDNSSVTLQATQSNQQGQIILLYRPNTIKSRLYHTSKPALLRLPGQSINDKSLPLGLSGLQTSSMLMGNNQEREASAQLFLTHAAANNYLFSDLPIERPSCLVTFLSSNLPV